MIETQKLWLTPTEAAPLLGYRSVQGLWRDLREGKFPWAFRRAGVRYKICARSIGLIPEANNEARESGESFTATA